MNRNIVKIEVSGSALCCIILVRAVMLDFALAKHKIQLSSDKML